MINEEYIKKRGKIIPVRTPLSIEIKKSIFALIFTLLVIIVLTSIVYLLNSSQSNQKGYSIKDEQIKQDQLVEQGRELIQKIIQAQSTHNLEENSIVQQMIKPEHLIYLENL